MNDFNRRLEQSSLRTWATLHTYTLQGLALRTAQGYTKRSNSVSVLDYDGGIVDMANSIMQCEAYYRAKQLPTIFKLTEDTASASFDRILEQKHYDKRDLSLVQWLSLNSNTPDYSVEHASIPNFPYDGANQLTISHHYADLDVASITEWVKLADVIGEMSEQAQQMIPQLLQASQCPYRGIIVYVEDQPAACALAVCDEDFVGIYDVMTGETFRRQGLARYAVNELLNWGKQMGAQYAYLQVVADNKPACRLYEQLGFQHAYRYWYRVENT
ncbi:GNAT family N-acetyltransferase [Paenibacillus kandeliae]|uniref:GNAT family N-acetyltransferase n=1 Tax=Paenibacillus kandeliae TaxID=3231269 RepID=UPI0034598D27